MTIDDAIEILDSRARFYVRAGAFALWHQYGQDLKLCGALKYAQSTKVMSQNKEKT